LCSAALQPSPELWASFLTHLEKLQESEVVNSDEAVAIVASEFIDDILVDYEGQADVDAEDMTEVIERVRSEYAGKAAHDLAVEQEKNRQFELRMRSLADWAASWTARCAMIIGWGVVAVGLYSLLAFAVRKPIWAWIGAAGVSILTAANLLWGTEMRDLASALEHRVRRILLSKLLPQDSEHRGTKKQTQELR